MLLSSIWRPRSAGEAPTMTGTMKRRKRTSDDSSLPVVTKRPDGTYAVQISHCASIVWHSIPDGPDHERFIVALETPAATEMITRETFKPGNSITSTVISKSVQ